jgi:hypothetical protein
MANAKYVPNPSPQSDNTEACKRAKVVESAQMTLCGDDYMLVPKPKVASEKALSDVKDNADQKSSSVSLVSNPSLILSKLLRRGMKMGKAGKSLRTTLWYGVGATSGANTALSGATAVTLSSGVDYSEIALVFNECKVHSVEAHVRAHCSGAATTLTSSWAHGFTRGSVPTVTGGTPDIMVMDGAKGPYPLNQSLVSTPGCYTDTGYSVSRIQLQPLIDSTVTPDVIGSSWAPTSQPGTVVLWNANFDAIGAGLTVTYSAFFKLDAEFRSRE